MPEGLKLFVLREYVGGPVVLGPDGKPMYFASKVTAKERRDANGKGEVVSLGPDHRRYTSGRN